MIDYQKLSELLREARNKLRLSQMEVSVLTEISLTALNRLETGDGSNQISIEVFVLLCELYQLCPHEVLHDALKAS